MFYIFAQSMLIGYSGAIMPGALLTYTLNKSIKSGAKAGLLISLGHAMLEFILVFLLFFGLGKFLGTGTAQMLIGFVGGAVLIFTGIVMVRDAYFNKVSVNASGPEASKAGGMILGSALISASNPYFIFWWVTVGLGLIMSAYKLMGLAGIVIFYFGHILSDITWYVFVAAVVAKTRKFIHVKALKIIIIVLGICLVGFGISFMASATATALKAF